MGLFILEQQTSDEVQHIVTIRSTQGVYPQ